MQLTVLAGLCLAPLAWSAPANTGDPLSANSLSGVWENTQAQNYHCDGRDVIRCETAIEGICTTVDSCESYCFTYESGSSCIDMSVPLPSSSKDVVTIAKGSVPEVDTTVSARDAAPQENKHYTCSRNRASVLICKYGFCSVDRYCGRGDECKDECNCCKSISRLGQGARSEVRTLPDQYEDAPMHITARGRNPKDKVLFVCSKDRASVLKCEYGFCATDYYCLKGSPCIDNPARCKKALYARG